MSGFVSEYAESSAPEAYQKEVYVVRLSSLFLMVAARSATGIAASEANLAHGSDVWQLAREILLPTLESISLTDYRWCSAFESGFGFSFAIELLRLDSICRTSDITSFIVHLIGDAPAVLGLSSAELKQKPTGHSMSDISHQCSSGRLVVATALLHALALAIMEAGRASMENPSSCSRSVNKFGAGLEPRLELGPFADPDVVCRICIAALDTIR